MDATYNERMPVEKHDWLPKAVSLILAVAVPGLIIYSVIWSLSEWFIENQLGGPFFSVTIVISVMVGLLNAIFILFWLKMIERTNIPRSKLTTLEAQISGIRFQLAPLQPVLMEMRGISPTPTEMEQIIASIRRIIGKGEEE